MPGSSLNELIRNLLIFILEYHWLYNFQWIGDLFKIKQDSSGCSVSSILEKLPISWKNVLQTASLEELQMFVSGSSNLCHWPVDLLNFGNKCRQFTRLLSQYILLNPNINSNNHLYGYHFNPTSMCTDLITSIQVDKIETNYFFKVSEKKSYELKQMSALIQTIVLSKLNIESVISSNIVFSLNEDQSCGNFQTVRLINRTLLENNILKVSNSSIPLIIVDIGSGLGNLSNYIAYRILQNCTNHLFTQFKVISIECDERMHLKALKKLNHYNSIYQTKLLSSIVKRMLFRVESLNLNLLQTRLHELSSGHDYLLLGLHCCGDLSQSMIELFHKDGTAKYLLLVGCCYHKMTLEKFPTSVYLRKAMIQCDKSFIEKCISTATLRLACQHSPLIWLSWTEYDSNKHRVRLLARIILDAILFKYNHITDEFEQYKRIDPMIHCDTIKKLLINDIDDISNQSSPKFDIIYSNLISFWKEKLSNILHFREVLYDDEFIFGYYEHFKLIWNLIPGLLALQQLFQPLLETIVLFDRLWCLREYGGDDRISHDDHSDPYRYSGYIRIFDPFLSPRCMALLVHKN
ncbi:unnamed protein product [Heterobilharzia americana]|nr:unnamed protein product [Heterobilharzia americana]